MSICILLLRSLDSTIQQATLEQRIAYSEQLLSLQRTQYGQLQASIEETKRARHDLRQHLHVIQAYLSTGNMQKLKDYLEDFDYSFLSDAFSQYCKHSELNTLMQYYGKKFTAENIKFDTRIDIPEKLPIPAPDLCIVFGNLLENALEACIGQENAYIRVGVSLSGEQFLSFIVDNTSLQAPAVKKGYLLSSKHNGQGIGTQSIKTIASQYNGTVDFHWENGMFFASVLLKLSNV